MKSLRLCTVLLTASLLAACEGEPPPPLTVAQFMDSPNLLEATMVRCAQDRSRTKYDPECVNARDASNRMAVAVEEQRRKELEAQFEQKRRQLRRTQDAAAEARRRAAEEERLREEAEYLGVFKTPPGTTDIVSSTAPNAATVDSTSPAPLNSGLEGNQPGVQAQPQLNDEAPVEAAGDSTDIDAIREELKRRQDSTG